jgi:ankyrin repeat protein
MYAAENGSSDIATLLLKHKARTDFKNCAGQTAADIAAAKGHKALANRLRP